MNDPDVFPNLSHFLLFEATPIKFVLVGTPESIKVCADRCPSAASLNSPLFAFVGEG
jgi:hypothetical protein